MGTGFGASVISWSQVELDGQWSAPVSRLQVGTAWSWVGEAIRVDGSSAPARPVAAAGGADERRRASRVVRHLLERAGALAPDAARDEAADEDDERTVTLTDGRSAWTVMLIDAGAGRPPLVLMQDPLPPRQTDLWVVSHRLESHPSRSSGDGGTGGEG